MIKISLENGTVISIENKIESFKLDPGGALATFEAADAFVSADYHLFKQYRYDKTDPKYKEYEEDTKKCVELHNKIVGKDDLFLFLGDLSEEEYGELPNSHKILKEIKDTVKKLNGRKIMLTGNNDSFSNTFYKECGFENILRMNELSKYTRNAYSHYPVNVSGGKLNIHGHIHGSHKYWSIDWHNHIDVYWKLWGGPKRISEFEKLYKSGAYKAETIHVDANAMLELGEDAGYDSHK